MRTLSAVLNSRSRSSSGRPIVRSVVFRIATRSQRRSASSSRWVVRKIVTCRSRRLLDQLVHLARGDRVEAGRRLVEEEHLGIAEQRPRQGHPLPQALRERAARIPRPVAQVDRRESAVDAIARSCDLIQLGEALEVLPDAQGEVEAGRLGHDRDPAPDLDPRLRRERQSSDPRRPRGRRDQRTERAHDGRLAGAVGAEESEDLAPPDLEGHIVEGDAVAEPLRQMFHRQRWGDVIDRRSSHVWIVLSRLATASPESRVGA